VREGERERKGGETRGRERRKEHKMHDSTTGHPPQNSLVNDYATENCTMKS
jgi:hypothetical protein